jgi:hypothetical protein
MLLARRKPDHITGTNLFSRATPALHKTAASRHDEGLAQGVGVPGGASAGLEGDAGGEYAGRSVCLDQGVYAYGAGEIFGGAFAGGL